MEEKHLCNPSGDQQISYFWKLANFLHFFLNSGWYKYSFLFILDA